MLFLCPAWGSLFGSPETPAQGCAHNPHSGPRAGQGELRQLQVSAPRLSGLMGSRWHGARGGEGQLHSRIPSLGRSRVCPQWAV